MLVKPGSGKIGIAVALVLSGTWGATSVVAAEPVFLIPHHVTLSVQDIGRESAWYHRVLGFTEVRRALRRNMTVCRMLIPGYRLDLVSVPSSTRPPQRARGETQGWMNAVFATPSLETAYKQLVANGVTVTVDRDTFGAMEHLTFEDPEGNEIGLAPPDPIIAPAGAVAPSR